MCCAQVTVWVQALKTNARYITFEGGEITFNSAILVGHLLATNDKAVQVEVKKDSKVYVQPLRGKNRVDRVWTLKLAYQGLEDQHAAIIAMLMQGNPFTTELDLSNNSMTARASLALSAMVELNSVLVSLDLSNNMLGDEGVKQLAESLGNNSTQKLRTLGLKKNDIGDSSIHSLVDKWLCLPHASGMRNLWLQGNPRITAVGARAIRSTLNRVDGVHAVGLDTGVALIQHAREHRMVNMHKQRLGDNHAILLSKVLDPTATVLQFRNNMLTGAGAAALTAPKLEFLLQLDLSYNRLGDIGALIVFENLVKVQSTVTQIRLAGNGISDLSMPAVVNAIHHFQLTLLNLDDNTIGDKGLKKIGSDLLGKSDTLEVD